MNRWSDMQTRALAIMADGKWHSVVDLASELRGFVDAKAALNRYASWFKIKDRPLEVKVAMGRRIIVMDRLNNWKRTGLLEADDKPGVRRSYRLNNKE